MAEKKNRTFEESMSRLEEIVNDLESNEKPLDETIALFEEGLKLVKNCDQKLKQFEQQVDNLISQNNKGDEDED